MTQTHSPATEAAAEADIAAGGRGLARLNPSPRQAYALTVKLDKVPGSFAAVNGYAQYDVSNDSECGQIHPQTGVGQRITSSEPVVLKKSLSRNIKASSTSISCWMRIIADEGNVIGK